MLFIANYEQGTRIFEADLLLTSDEQLVARHEWTTGMSKKSWVNRKFFLLTSRGRY
ncbi:hypothetical protein ACFSQ7_05735 [Paenibacillus rhizoplanae]